MAEQSNIWNIHEHSGPGVLITLYFLCKIRNVDKIQALDQDFSYLAGRVGFHFNLRGTYPLIVLQPPALHEFCWGLAHR